MSTYLNTVSSLDINIIFQKGKVTTPVYHKATFSRIYTHSDSSLQSTDKIGKCFQEL